MGCKGGRGRRKVPLVKITDNKSLVRTFNRRHRTLIHKSEQLSVLCGVRVAVSIQSPQTTTGDFIEAAFDGSSSSSSPMMIIAEEEEEEEEERGKGRRKKIEKIGNRESLNVTFSKRRSGLFKLAEELSVLCGVRVALSVRSPGGRLVEKTFRGGGGGGGGDDMDDQSQKQHHVVLETTPACDHQALSPTSSSLEHQQPQQLDIGDSHEFIDKGGIAYLSLDETIDEIMGLEEPLMEVGPPPHDDDYNAAAAAAAAGLRDIGWSSDDLAYVDQIRNAWAEGVAFADSCFSYPCV